MLNIPNALSISRMFLAPVFVVFAALGSWPEAFVVFCIAAFTDLIDGAIARLFKQKSKLGSFLDPMADKILMASAFITLTIAGLIPFWLTIVVFSRDLMISAGIGYLYYKRIKIKPNPTILSKVTTLFQILTLASALAPSGLQYFGVSVESTQIYFEMMPYLLGSTLMFTIITGVQYYEKGLRVLKKRTTKQAV